MSASMNCDVCSHRVQVGSAEPWRASYRGLHVELTVAGVDNVASPNVCTRCALKAVRKEVAREHRRRKAR